MNTTKNGAAFLWRYPLARGTMGWLMVHLQIYLAVVPQLPAEEHKLAPLARPAAAAPVQRVPPSPAVQVNRTIPTGAVDAPSPLTFSSSPTDDELFRAAVLPEPLVPVGRKPAVEENRALARALEQYLKRTNPEDVSDLDRFLQNHPESPWRVSVLVNLGILHYRACRFSQTFPAWQEAWQLGKDAAEPRAKALVDRAMAELIKMNARVGRIAALDALFADLGERPLSGSANEIVAAARQGLYRMKNEPWVAFRCGPLALDRIMAFENPNYAIQDCTYHSRSTTNGLSLQQVHELSRKMGMKMQPARRQPGSKVLLPAIINWNVGHYAALVREENGKFLVQDPTFGPELWISRETLEQEASGYFLVKAAPLPQGWSAVDEAEAGTVFGKGDVTSHDPNKPDPNEPQQPPTCPTPMTAYGGKLMSVSLHLQDTPVAYQPPRGSAIRFTVDYNQREQNQPANFAYANFGPKWTFNWVSYVTDDPNSPGANVTVFLPGGGQSLFNGFNAASSTYSPETESRAVLTRTSASSYSLQFPDGSKHLFTRPVGAASPRKVFLTGMVDPHGNPVDLFYDGTNRLIAIRDAIGQVSTISYEVPSDIYKVTKITDPFGRFARFDYQDGYLTNITDVIGIRSRFTYGGGDFIDTLTTPYGTSRFRSGESGVVRWLEMSDPEGATERIEFRNQTPGIPFTDPTGVPRSMNAFNDYMWSRNTYYWDKKAFQEAVGDYTRAKIYHWLHTENINVVSGILESEKEPLENRVWYNYPGQSWAGGVNAGMIGKPSKIGRILDDGSTQLYQYDYNSLGKVTKQVDPMGRTTVYTYATNLVDLLETRQTAGVNEVLETRTYNAQHLPLTVADGSGHTNRFTYNDAGQLLTATNPRNDITTLSYDTNGYLLSIDGPLPGTSDTTSFTYDAYGHARTATDSEGYTLTYDYDVLDRLTRITYPDGTYEENIYLNLDRVAWRDRNGRVTQFSYDANRHLTSVEDPLHRITRYDWCSCGQMESLIDPMGRVTQWHRDIQGRVIGKEYVDGSQVRYTYEGTTSRLKTVTDEKGQVKVYDYLPDGNLWRVSYLNAENPTPTVTFSYDGPYNRIKTMTDGIGLTTYGYYPANTNGGRLAFVDGPLTKDTVTYDYDELGRVKTRAIDGVAQRWDYDTAGRLTVVSNVLGAFTNTYAGATYRLANTTYPNGQWTEYTYYNNLGDQRLREIHHKLPGNQTLSRFEYAYDPAGQITNWLQQAGAGVPEIWAIGYDAAQQLLSVVSTTNSVVNRTYGYGYDPAGNRLFEEINGLRRNFSYNVLNQIQTSDDSTIAARTYRWDSENRLVGIVRGTKRQEIDYDGLGRYVRIRERDGVAVTNDTRLVWCGDLLREVRNAADSSVQERFLYGGQLRATGSFFCVRDHLNSVRDVTDTSGNLATRFKYAPFGIQISVETQADNVLGATFTGHYSLLGESLLLTRFRPYEPELARWLNRDPLMELAGVNLFAYVRNNPINDIDPLGLINRPPAEGGGSDCDQNAAFVKKFCEENPQMCAKPSLQNNPLNQYLDQTGSNLSDKCQKNPISCGATAAAVAAAALSNGLPKEGQPISLPPLPVGGVGVSISVTPGGSGWDSLRNTPSAGGIMINIPIDSEMNVNLRHPDR
jgi:RHS repeat-associated protein